MNIKEIDINDKAYAEISAQASVFNSPQWLSIYGSNLKLLGLFNNDEKLFGAFFIYVEKKAGLTRFRCAPYTPHCGLFFSSLSKNRSSINSFNKEVIEQIVDYLNSRKPALLTLAFPTKFNDMQFFNWSGYKVIPNYTYQIDLQQSIDDITKEFDPKNRNIISKVEKEEHNISDSCDKETLFKFLSTSLDTAGARVYSQLLKKIICDYSNPDNSFVFVLKNKEGQISSAVMCIYDRHSAYYLLAGNNRDHMINGANNLLLQKSIIKAKELGCKVFDFEGSMIKSVEKFFRGFGGQIVPYYTVNKGKFLIETVLKLKMPSTF
jgi:hypothetical protein